MDSKNFSPAERERANAFVHAFGKHSEKKEQGPVVQPPRTKEAPAVSKPKPKAVLVDPSVTAEEGPPPKVNIGAEFNARKLEAAEKEALYNTERPSQVNYAKALLIIAVLAVIGLSVYNFDAIKKVRSEQARILENQKVLFDKLARVGKRLRLGR